MDASDNITKLNNISGSTSNIAWNCLIFTDETMLIKLSYFSINNTTKYSQDILLHIW